ncbi:MAG: Rap1a/Tai family immunity protein [Parvibaculum sedimenti]|uniref:Rap1a/Tai family immunity protein n=1 Tax=Parvibaculum sedimenti TaxID=2608632 RepID=UPI003BB71BA4
MRKSVRFAVPLLAAVAAASAAWANPGADIKTGADLVAACNASVDMDMSEKGQISATACNQFLAGMVVAVYNATEAGMPTKLHRLGPKKDEEVCFRLPEMLKYQEFAALVVEYNKTHPELAERPAAELAGRSLADKFPCKEVK